jgi:hypothetical protein
MRLGLRDRLRLALSQDQNIVVSAEEALTHPGFPVDHFEELGLTKTDLKKLNRIGAALRGYTKNVWLPGETMPNGVTVPTDKPGIQYRGNGHRVRWVLIAKEEPNGV